MKNVNLWKWRVSSRTRWFEIFVRNWAYIVQAEFQYFFQVKLDFAKWESNKCFNITWDEVETQHVVQKFDWNMRSRTSCREHEAKLLLTFLVINNSLISQSFWTLPITVNEKGHLNTTGHWLAYERPGRAQIFISHNSVFS